MKDQMIDLGLDILCSLGARMAVLVLIVLLVSWGFKKNAFQQGMTKVCGDLPGQVNN